MLLKSIQLTDFRQFKGKQEPIHFSTDSEKNVTIILGDNGTGKTTLAQAFTWCLYGKTDFRDKSVLCKATAQELTPNGEATVKVKLILNHNNKDYTITRELRYTKSANGSLRSNQYAVLSISYKGDDGQQEFVEDAQTEFQIKKILPEDLARYFFFNGERLDAMKEEIDKGKSTEFGKAVRGILGLGAFQEALAHLKSVIKSYDNSFDSSGNATIAKYKADIDRYEAEIEKINARLEDISNEETLAHDKCVDLAVKIKENERSQVLANEVENLISKRKGLVTSKSQSISKMFQAFNSKAHNYFAKRLMKDALEFLSNEDKIDKGIPDIHQRTIEFLIERGECLCGADIEKDGSGNKAFRKLKELEAFIPPQSVGSEINNFIDQCKLRSENGDNLYEDVADKYSVVRDFEGEFATLESAINAGNETLKTMKDVGELQREKMRQEAYLGNLKIESSTLNQKKGDFTTKRDRCVTERHDLNIRNENNRRIETYMAYAKEMYDAIDTLYKEKENSTRIELEAVVNEIFRSIYDGGFSLAVDEKYGIQIIVNDYEGFDSMVETSTAQSLSVIFAFIAGVTKMARSNSTESEMSVTEPYPLVMDAPLSAFDKTRIKTICDALPKASEQVIVFIKDTDGELAEEHMGSKVDIRYIFDKRNEFETYVMER